MAPFSPDQMLRPESNAAPAPRPASEPQVTTVAMEKFGCISERCEDTCCRDWAVEIDKPSLDRMRAAMGRTEEGRQRLVRLVVIGPPSRHTGAPAHLQMGENGACPMLDEKHLCGVHASYGEEVLSTACSVFPRTALAAQGQLEVGGSLACPEVARLVLFAGDGELELRPASRPMLPRAYVGRTVAPRESSARAAAFRPIRAAMTRLLRLSGYPLGSRLAFVAAAAERLDAFLRDADAETSEARRAFALRRLDGELADAETPDALATLDRELGRLGGCGDGTVALVATLLVGRKRLPHSPRFAALLDGAFGSLQSEILGRPATPDDAVTPAALWEVYRARRDALDARAGEVVGALFANYGTHYLQRNPATEAPALLVHVHALALHLAALRLMLAGHPAIAAMLRAPADAAADTATVKDAAVNVIQTYTKAVGHSVEFQEVIRKAVPADGLFGQVVMLAKFV